MYIPNQLANTGYFVGTTQLFDSSAIRDIDVSKPEFKELLINLYQNVNNIILSLNAKVTGYHIQEEFLSGKLYFNPTSNNPQRLRPSYTKTIDFGGLTNNTDKAVPHGIPFTDTYTMLSVTAVATDPVNLGYLPIPRTSNLLANQISISVDGNDVIIRPYSNRTNYTRCIVTLEYLKES